MQPFYIKIFLYPCVSFFLKERLFIFSIQHDMKIALAYKERGFYYLLSNVWTVDRLLSDSFENVERGS